MIVRRRIAFLVALICALPIVASAQVTGRGQELWGCWPRSHLSLETSAELIVMADAPTTAQVDGAFTAGPAAVAPGAPWIVPIPETMRMAAERTVLQAGFRVRSLDPAQDIVVTLRVPRQAEASDDTARLLPKTELGTSYYVTSYPASLPGEPSLYAVVATEDATSVSAAVPCGGMVDSVVLDAGEAYQIFCDWRDVPADVSGAQVTSDKPIAVFGGNSDAFVPTNYLSGDFVIEQLAPVVAWGTEFYVVPIPKGPAAIPGAHDIVRVTPKTGGTLVVDDGGSVTPVRLRGAGMMVELQVSVPVKLTADVPVEVYQFACGHEMTDIGDPFMVQVPATTHWGVGARAWIPAYYTLGNYLHLVTDRAAAASAQVDGAAVTGWTSLPGGTHSWARVDLGTLAGERVVSCDAPVAVIAFGFNDTYLPDPGLGRTPGSHGTVAAHASPPCLVFAQADIPSSSCLGATLALREAGSTMSGCPALEFRWLKDGVEIPGCGFAPAGTCDVVFDGDATYEMEARCVGLAFCVGRTAQRVVDQPAPPVAILPDPARTCAGAPLRIEGTAGFQLYSWTSDVPDPGVTPRSSGLPSLVVTPEQDTVYTLVAEDVRGCTSTANLLVTVTPDPLPPALGASVRVTKAGATDVEISWQDLPTIWRGYEVPCLPCSGREWPARCAGMRPDPVTIQSASPIGAAVPPGTLRQSHVGAIGVGDLFFYKVRATSNCAGTPGPTCNPWPMQLVPCP